MDRLRETGRSLGRVAVACACAATLAVSGPVRAQEPEAEGASGSKEPTEELNAQAEQHALKALNHFNNGAYVDAEEEFRRVAFFVPNWRPLHYNLGVLAEAQGKLGTAVSEYKAFRPHASPDEQMMVDQRIDELGRRRGKIAGAYKRQIALSATAMTLGVGAVGGAAFLFVLMAKRGNDADTLNAEADKLEQQSYTEMPPLSDQHLQDAADKRAEADSLTKNKNGLLYGGIYLAIFGLLAVGYSVIPLRNAVRSKRQLDGIALGPTRLKWNGGAGFQLRF